MEELAARCDPREPHWIGFQLYERFGPDVRLGNEGWAAKAVLEIENIPIKSIRDGHERAAAEHELVPATSPEPLAPPARRGRGSGDRVNHDKRAEG